jgi:nucleoside-diphosphate-sugar epimerase
MPKAGNINASNGHPEEDANGATWWQNKSVLITGGLGFIGSNLAIRLVELGAQVTLVDSLIPEYGGNRANIVDFKDRVDVNIADVRDPHAMGHLIQNKH